MDTLEATFNHLTEIGFKINEYKNEYKGKEFTVNLSDYDKLLDNTIELISMFTNLESLNSEMYISRLEAARELFVCDFLSQVEYLTEEDTYYLRNLIGNAFNKGSNSYQEILNEIIGEIRNATES